MATSKDYCKNYRGSSTVFLRGIVLPDCRDCERRIGERSAFDAHSEV